jgi:viroplasmin and RNaseH domain-containing protein
VGRFNYYAVKRGYNSGLYFNWPDCERQVKGYSSAQFKGFHGKEYFNWPDCERQVKGYSSAQFKGFQGKEDAENYLLA